MTEIPSGEGSPRRELPKEQKIVQMPDRENMVKRLTDAELYGASQPSDKVYNSFIGQFADSPKIGLGLVLAWQLAIDEGLTDAPAEVRETVETYFDLQFDRIMDTVVPDQEAAEQAKMFMRDFEEKVKGKKRD